MASFGGMHGVGAEGVWSPLLQLLNSSPPAEADGAAAAHSPTARDEAARKLVTNHLNVLRDVTNGAPVTQLELKRVSTQDAQYVDQAMREVARRLLGRRPGVLQLEVRLDPSTPAQAVAWAATAQYLAGRIAVPRDMSAAAGAAIRGVLMELGTAALDSMPQELARSLGGDPQLESLAAAMGTKIVKGGTWLHMFCVIAEQLPYAVVVTDMRVPGLPMTYCNKAFQEVTGFAKDETEGKNCRFLQGKATEAASVRVMVNSIRAAKPVTVRVTNYRKDGSEFVNVLTLHPVHDSDNEYRYSIGILADAAKNNKKHLDALSKLRSFLPTTFDVKLQVKVSLATAAEVDMVAQQKQWKSSLGKFTRLLWSMDWEGSLNMIMSQPKSLKLFGSWLSAQSPSDGKQLEMAGAFLQLTQASSNLTAASVEAVALCQKYLDSTPASGDAAMTMLQQQVTQCMKRLAAEAFPKFVQSKACLPLVEELLGGSSDELKRVDHLLWDEYEVPADCAGWIHSFAAVAETHPACIVICDSSMPGNPMFFTNGEFCRVTGYSKKEAQGRNCRFLQGPRTEPQSVAVIQDTLRRGVDCHVKITNYRKTGELFENLLTMRPVHDSNGVYRFCIGVQFEVMRDMNLKQRLSKLDKLIKLLPSTIEVASVRTGIAHNRAEAAIEQTTALETKLETALVSAGSTIGPQISGVVAEAGYYADHHADMLAYCGAAGGWEPLREALDAIDAGNGLVSKASGAAGGHKHPARYEAARKLILNHAAVLRDVTNPNPATQLQLVRAKPEESDDADAALREVARRLLGKVPGVTPVREELPTKPAVWAVVGKYLSARVQGSAEEKPGREPDMSATAAAAFRAVLLEVGASNGRRRSDVGQSGSPQSTPPGSPPMMPAVQQTMSSTKVTGLRALLGLRKK